MIESVLVYFGIVYVFILSIYALLGVYKLIPIFFDKEKDAYAAFKCAASLMGGLVLLPMAIILWVSEEILKDPFKRYE